MFPYHAVAREELSSSSRASEVEALYREHRTLLFFVARRKFGVPSHDSEALVQDVFLAYLQCDAPIRNIRAWLVAAMCNASRHYLRRQDRYVELPSEEELRLVVEAGTHLMLAKRLLSTIPRKEQEALRLRFFEGLDHKELAAALDTTERYAQKLVMKALSRLRRWFIDGEQK